MDAILSRKQAIAARLRAAREQAGLSQGQAAKVVGLHRPAITEIEAGRRGVNAEELAALADAYGVSVNWLVEAEKTDPVRDLIELAACELGKLKVEDLDLLMQLLSTLKRGLVWDLPQGAGPDRGQPVGGDEFCRILDG